MVTVQIELPLEDVRALYEAVCEALKYWPGGEPEEQEKYQQLKLFLFSILCEASLDVWTKVVATLSESLKKQGKERGNILVQITDAKNSVDKENNI